MADVNSVKYINLLNQVSFISRKYDEIARITGQKFNIFKILKIESKEVGLHSLLIAELLNPKGHHGLGVKFLELFLTLVFVTENEVYHNLPDAKVEVEKWLGNIDKSNNEGGFIDIFLQISEKKIIIENKVFASDQTAQIRRYHNAHPEAKIIYLTLNGNAPSEGSVLNNDLKGKIDLTNISYKHHIKNWIELCIKEAANFPLLRETLSQYLSTLKNLTHQSETIEMENEIIKQIVKSPENIQAAFFLAGLEGKIRVEIMKRIEEKMVENAQSLGLMVKVESNNRQLGKAETSFSFHKEVWGELRVKLYFVADDVLAFGITNESFSPENESLKAHFSNYNPWNNNYSSTWAKWYWIAPFNEWKYTSWENRILEIPKMINEKLKEVVEELEKVDFI